MLKLFLHKIEIKQNRTLAESPTEKWQLIVLGYVAISYRRQKYMKRPGFNGIETNGMDNIYTAS